jgi:hypothetical protein
VREWIFFGGSGKVMQRGAARDEQDAGMFFNVVVVVVTLFCGFYCVV